MKPVTVLVVILIMILGCTTKTGPADLDPIIISEWGTAQYKLLTEGWKDEFSVKRTLPEFFNFYKSSGPFNCNDMLANGCFSPPSDITWNTETPTVIRHEAGHAILYYLRDSQWPCYEHAEKCLKGHEEYERCYSCPTCKQYREKQNQSDSQSGGS